MPKEPKRPQKPKPRPIIKGKAAKRSSADRAMIGSAKRLGSGTTAAPKKRRIKKKPRKSGNPKLLQY